MKTGKIKKLCALALALALGVTSLVGCGSNETGDSSTETENNQTSSTTETTESEQELVYKVPMFTVGNYVFVSNNVVLPAGVEFCNPLYNCDVDFENWEMK